MPLNQSGSSTQGALLHVPSSYSGGSSDYPLLIFLHGAGEGNGNPASIYNNSTAGGPSYFIHKGDWPSSFTNPANGQSYQFIVLSPQNATGWSTSGAQLRWVINYMVNNYRIDINRIYLTGLSAGGMGINQYVTKTGVTPDYKVAAIAPMSAAHENPAANTSWAQIIVADSIRSWFFGDDPGDTFGTYAKLFATQMNSIKSGFARYTDYSGGHCCWNTFYNPTYKENVGGANMNIYEWMLQYTRGAAADPINQPPHSVAGQDQTIILPTNSVTVNGSESYDNDGTIVSYAWSKISGGSATITSASSASTTITGLSEGTYTFELTVTDDSSATDKDTLQIIVLPEPPEGGSQINVQIYSGSNGIVSTEWNKWNTVSSLSITGLKFTDGNSSSIAATLSAQTGVSDNGTGFNTTTPPKEVGRYSSYHWPARTLTISNLNPAHSYDIILYSNRNNTGQSTDFTLGSETQRVASSGNLSNTATFTSITPSETGVVVIDIKQVVDYNYLNGFTIIDKDAVVGPPNELPVVNAGVDQEIAIDSVSLSGTAEDVDGTIASVEWSTVLSPFIAGGGKAQAGGDAHTINPAGNGRWEPNSQGSFKPGDTIYLSGYFKSINMSNISGSPDNYIVITNKPNETLIIGDSLWAGGAYAQAFTMHNCHYIELVGSNRDKFKIVGSNVMDIVGGGPAKTAYQNLAITKFSDNVSIHDITFRHGGSAIYIKTDVLAGDSLTWFPNRYLDNIEIYRCNIFNTHNEGMYIGHTAAYWNINTNAPYYPSSPSDVTASSNPTVYKRPIKLRNVKIFSNTVRDCGSDGIQTAAIDNLEIYNNEVVNWATSHDVSHNGGILIGGRIVGFDVYDNYLHDGWGEFIQVYAEGGGISKIRNNLLANNERDGISTRGSLGLTLEVTNNTIAFVGGTAIRINGFFGQTPAQILSKNIIIAPGLANSYIYTENGASVTEDDNRKFSTYDAAEVDSTDMYSSTGEASEGAGFVLSGDYVVPNPHIIVTPNELSTIVRGLVEGVYIFRLSVTDNDGAVSTNDVTVTVSIPSAPPIEWPGFHKYFKFPSGVKKVKFVKQ